MNLEEIKQLSDSELGRRLAEAAGFKTVHRIYYRSPEFSLNPLISLCRSLDAVAEVEKFVISEKGDGREYADALENVLYRDKTFKTFSPTRWDLISATARQRAEAAYLALTSNGTAPPARTEKEKE